MATSRYPHLTAAAQGLLHLPAVAESVILLGGGLAECEVSSVCYSVAPLTACPGPQDPATVPSSDDDGSAASFEKIYIYF